jgi:uncharacterized repeat protein (TIGR01451 family)
VLKPLVPRVSIALVAVGTCALVAGCLTGGSSSFPYLLPNGPAVQTHSKPPGPGYFADFDPQACRIEVRPDCGTAPVRGAQVFIATVYDGAGNSRRNRRVEWMLEGPGSIVEVDESGFLHDRGLKVDNKFAYSLTNYLEHTLNRGGNDFAIGPGQTWCVVTSAVEGETTVIAYAPAIADWEKNRAYVKVNWVQGHVQGLGLGQILFPPPIDARTGGDCTLGTRVSKDSDAGYRIRYRIIDGPPAALASTRGESVETVMEAIATPGADGTARVSISQPAPVAGTNRIAIEVIKTNPDRPGEFTVVSKGQTKVTWRAAELGVSVSAPKNIGLNQEVTVNYAVSGAKAGDTGALTLIATVPEGMEVVRTQPRAVVDGDELIWTIPDDGKTQRAPVRAIFRTSQVGEVTLTANVRSRDGLTSRGSTLVQIAESKLIVKLDGPSTGLVGESLPFRITVTNPGDGPVERVKIQARLADGLETTSKQTRLEETVASLAPGQSKTIALPVSARRAGKLSIQAGAATSDLAATPQTAAVDVQDAQLSVSVHGPAQGYVGQEITWQLVVRNSGEVPLGNVVVKSTLPPEVTFLRATDGGRISGKQVVWDLGDAPANQERTIAITGTCANLASRAVVSATVAGTPRAERDGVVRTVSLVKPIGSTKPAEAALEITGVPALQMSVKDSEDPINVGQRTTYVIKVKNAGTMAAKRVEVQAEVAANIMRAIRATGPGQAGKIDGQRVTFPAIDSLAPNAEASFVVEVEGLIPGDARFRAEVRSPVLAQPLRAEEPTRILGR